MVEQIRHKNKDLKPHKSAITASFGSRTVLTKSHWEFVSLWLTREKMKDALFYWNQAREFFETSKGVHVQSAPLLLYYSFMNATKALLTTKSIMFDERHSVGAHNIRAASKKVIISNEGVRIQQRGILPELSRYFGEKETKVTHSLQELLFNLPFVHRTYCLTYVNQAEQFYPLTDCRYVFNTTTKKAYLSAKLSKDYDGRRYLNRLPPTFMHDSNGDGERSIRSIDEITLTGPLVRKNTDINSLLLLHRKLRQDLHYINGAQTLWYIKSTAKGPARLERSPITLTLAAMHRLSEICRYKPIELAAFLSGQNNWLISEFIQMAPEQFFDQIASEITGYQFMAPNIRPAT